MDYPTIIRMAQEVARTQELPLEYSSNEGGPNNFNCYAYALGLSSLNWYELEVTPGFMNGPTDIENDVYYDQITNESIIPYVIEDLQVLGRKMEPDTFGNEIMKNSYKIAIYVGYEGFHFIRQNKDGSWSEKDGWGGEVQLTSHEWLMKHNPYYKFLGVYRISKQAE